MTFRPSSCINNFLSKTSFHFAKKNSKISSRVHQEKHEKWLKRLRLTKIQFWPKTPDFLWYITWQFWIRESSHLTIAWLFCSPVIKANIQFGTWFTSPSLQKKHGLKRRKNKLKRCCEIQSIFQAAVLTCLKINCVFFTVATTFFELLYSYL